MCVQYIKVHVGLFVLFDVIFKPTIKCYVLGYKRKLINDGYEIVKHWYYVSL